MHDCLFGQATASKGRVAERSRIEMIDSRLRIDQSRGAQYTASLLTDKNAALCDLTNSILTNTAVTNATLSCKASRHYH
jgi:hypothetical protein